MARVPFRLPDIGEGIAEAEIVTWHVKIGDMVEEDQPVADMMTDKATVEMAAPVSGRVVELAGAVGDQIAIGSTLIVFETEDGEAAAPAPVEAPKAEPVPAPKADPVPAKAETPVAAVEAPKAAVPTSSRKVLASPAVRLRAKELGVDLADVHPYAGDRVKHSDLDAFLKYQGGGSASKAAPRAA